MSGRRRISLRELVEIALRDPGVPVIRDELSEHTKAARVRTLSRFLAWAERYHDGRILADKVTPSMVAHWLETFRWNGCRSSTIQRHATILRRAYNYARELELVADNPVRSRPRRKSLDERRQSVSRKALTDAELARILDRDDLPPYLRHAIILGVETGLRPGALRGLRWADVDLPARLITVRAETSKGGAQRAVISDAALELLEELPRVSVFVLTIDGEPLPPWRLVKPCRPFFPVGKSFRSLRHTFALRAVEAGVRPHHLRLMLGHSSLSTTQVYLKSELEDHVEEILGALGSSPSRTSSHG